MSKQFICISAMEKSCTVYAYIVYKHKLHFRLILDEVHIILKQPLNLTLLCGHTRKHN